MTSNMNNLFRMSLLIRNLSVMSNHAMFFRSIRTVTHSKTMWEESKITRTNASNMKLVPPEKYFRYTISKLRDCNNHQEVFTVFHENQKLTGEEALQILTALFKLDKQNPKINEKIYQKKEFSLLCDILRRDVRQLSESETLQALKVLNYFHVPTSTVIVQMLLQMIRQYVNALSIEQIIFLDFLLTKFQKTPLVDALLIALPIVLQTKVKNQLDTDNLDTMTNVLEYLHKESITITNKSDIITAILMALNKFDEQSITPKHAKTLFKILMTMKIDESNAELLRKIQQVLVNSMDLLTVRDITTLLYKMSRANKVHQDMFYHEGFTDACATVVVSKDFGFQTATNILTSFNILRHTNNSLLDYIAAKCFEDKKLMNNVSSIILHNIIVGMTTADYKPVFWDTLRESLLTEKLLQCAPSVLVKNAVYLASLDCFWPPLLAKAFTAKLKNVKHTSLKKLLLLYQTVKSNYPEYEGPWPNETIFDTLQTKSPDIKGEFPLKGALECALGGSQYVITDVKTSLGYDLDHVVIMRKGGFPIAINNFDESTPKKLDELKAPLDSQVITFMLVPYFGYARNTQRLTGFFSLLLRTLKVQTGFTVIPIVTAMWKNLSVAEQQRYISQAIRLKCDELSASVNS